MPPTLLRRVTHHYVTRRFKNYADIGPASELPENHEEMFPRYYMDSDVIKPSTTHQCVTRRQKRVKLVLYKNFPVVLVSSTYSTLDIEWYRMNGDERMNEYPFIDSRLTIYRDQMFV